LAEWIGKGRLLASQVAILSPWRQPRSSLADISSLRGMPLTNDLDTWRTGKAVLVDTIKRFKGLEADALLLIDIPTPESVPSFKLSDLYVACSRAKHLLTVLTTSDRVRELVGEWDRPRGCAPAT
jgi:superfamily I DNA/RNA helicase